ncbi:MAG TPA: glutathione S-transferase family protein [Candidatus Limnocylindrales bacterium]|nr:glutathione S-transferase family protein [Candidatus Limnocylindrales bacterium]
MHDIILHHYPISLFAEKIRCLLAYKNVPWRSVAQPNMLPKPDLAPLTGGYRKIPVMQVGADIYCDTACIARRIEQLHPDPACIPEDRWGEIGMLEDWADHRFTGQVVPSVIAELLPVLPADILEDRAKMSPMLSKQNLLAMAPHTRSQALLSLDQLDCRLSGKSFLIGDEFTLADAACYHPLWFMRHIPHLFEAVSERRALASWVDRIAAFGAGDSEAMEPSAALEIARTATPADLAPIEGRKLDGIEVGDTVSIRADDIGVEKVEGVVARVTGEEIAIRRSDPVVGEIAVHFPRSGYVIAKAA